MKHHRKWALASVLLAVTALNGNSLGQSSGDFDYQQPRAFPGQAGMGARGGRQDRAVRFSNYTDAYGKSVVVPASYSPAGYPPGCGCSCGPAYGGPPGGMGSCNMCGPGGPGVYGPCPPSGTCPPFGYDDGMSDLIGAGSMGLNQAGPHYFDVRAEVVFMSRDETFGQSLLLTTDNIDPTAATVSLNTNDLQFDSEPGFRIVGRLDLGPLSVFEFGFLGIYGWDSSAVAQDVDGTGVPITSGEGDLFSLFSGVFLPPIPPALTARFFPNNIPTAGGPHPQTERSTQQSVRISADLQTAEMTFRRYWVGYTPRISGTILAGARYTRLSEDFNFNTIGSESFNYDIDAENDLVGFQTGGDMWISLMQGVRVGTEGKAGIYNNRFKLNSAQSASSTAGLILKPGTTELAGNENFRGDNVSFIGEGSLDVVVDVLPSWSIRAGYEVLFINNLALAGNNFNSGKIYSDQPELPDRVSFLDDGGTAFYHGWRVGAEYIW